MINVVGLHEVEEPVPIEREGKLILHCLDPTSGISPCLSTCGIFQAKQPWCWLMWPETPSDPGSGATILARAVLLLCLGLAS